MDRLLRQVEDGEISPLVAQKRLERGIKELRALMNSYQSIYNHLDKIIFETMSKEEIEKVFNVKSKTYKKK